MRRFVFRLERVLDVRKARERVCETRLVAARLALSHAQGQRQNTRARAEASRRRLCLVLGASFSTSAAGWEEEHMSGLDLLERAQNVLVAAASREVAGSQDTLLVARRDRKTLERLRRRRAADHLYRANREDGRELDDMFRARREVR
ncbi:MAG: hypothetical protein Q8P50_09575 [Bacillota bacterium]|nr:hypothetical protein [Bacillota bacterium]